MGDLASRLLSLTTSPDLIKIIIYIWLRLRYLTEFLALTPDHLVDECLFSDKIDHIERHALTLMHSPSLHSSRNVTFLTAFLNACFIYIYEELRECPRWNNLSVSLSERIYSGLLMVDLEEVADCCPDLLLWVLILGRSGVIPIGEPPAKIWYAEAIEDLGFRSNFTILGKVKGIMYFEIAEGISLKATTAAVGTENGEEANREL